MYVLQQKTKDCNVSILCRFCLHRAEYSCIDVPQKAFKKTRCSGYIHCSGI